MRNAMLKMQEEGLGNITFVYLSAFLFGVLGALIAFIIAHYFIRPFPAIGTVNITHLVDRFIKEESAKNLPPEMLKNEVKAFSLKLERELKTISVKHHLILLPSEAVVAGSHDYTKLIRERLANQRAGSF